MNNDQTSTQATTAPNQFATLHSAQRRALEAIFRHPTAHNLEWMDVVELIRKIGTVKQTSSGEFSMEVAGAHHLMHKPHTKDLTSSEVTDLRHFLQNTGWSPDALSQASSEVTPVAPILMVVLDHHDARVYAIDLTSTDTTKQEIRPYDPHHFLHHLTHKGQASDQGERAPEDATFYKRIAAALALGGQIMVVGHGNGKSNAARHLAEYLRTHHNDIYRRIVGELTVDLSSITSAQLLALAQKTLNPATPTAL